MLLQKIILIRMKLLLLEILEKRNLRGIIGLIKEEIFAVTHLSKLFLK